MGSSRSLGSSLLVLGGFVAIGLAACTTLTQRKEWTTLTSDEQQSYLDANLCLMSAAPVGDVNPNAQNRWDELHWVHIKNQGYVHAVGQFLPWHRYYITVHERLLQDECGYTGPMPYWNETRDVGDIASSVVLTDDAFGGDGDSSDGCLRSGPYANTTLHLAEDGSLDPYCLSREFDDQQLSLASQTNIDTCMAKANYSTAWSCWGESPHSAGHGGIGGTMVNVALSPGDPIFFMHHTWLDYNWWLWQSEDLPARLTEMGGNNYFEAYTDPAFLDYFGDNGDVTTLNHTLWVLELLPNVTIGDVMDTGGDVICAEYV